MGGQSPFQIPLQGGPHLLHIILRQILLMAPIVLQPFKARQVHSGFRQSEEYTESWEVLTLYSGVGQSMHAAREWEAPTPLYTKCIQSQQGAKILYNKV